MKEFRWFSSSEEIKSVDPSSGYGSCVAYELMSSLYKLFSIQNALQQSTRPIQGIDRAEYEDMAFNLIGRLAEKMIGDSDNFEISLPRQYVKRKKLSS
jgi:hypothetical protein